MLKAHPSTLRSFMKQSTEVEPPVNRSFSLAPVGTLQRASRGAMSVVAGRPVPVLMLVGVALVPLAAVNAVGLAQTGLWLIRHGGTGGDWLNLSALSVADPYAVEAYRWSPPAAWIWATAVVPLGLPLWQALHLGALMLLRDWRVILLALLSWAFWQDLANGNVMTFVVVSAWWALRGNTVGAVAFLALSVLVPRPLMLPVLAWLLVKQPRVRLWFAFLAVLVIGLALASGQMGDWMERTLVTGRDELGSIWNIGPSRIIGPIWVPIGIGLAAALAMKGWLGIASVVIGPYLFPYYMLMGLLDVPRLLPGGASRVR
jgi:hypothetical protein